MLPNERTRAQFLKIKKQPREKCFESECEIRKKKKGLVRLSGMREYIKIPLFNNLIKQPSSRNPYKDLY